MQRLWLRGLASLSVYEGDQIRLPGIQGRGRAGSLLGVGGDHGHARVTEGSSTVRVVLGHHQKLVLRGVIPRSYYPDTSCNRGIPLPSKQDWRPVVTTTMSDDGARCGIHRLDSQPLVAWTGCSRRERAADHALSLPSANDRGPSLTAFVKSRTDRRASRSPFIQNSKISYGWVGGISSMYKEVYVFAA